MTLLRRRSLNLKISVCVIAVLGMMMVLNVALSSSTQQHQAEAEMLEKAQILATELDASWRFVDMNQDIINTDSDGSYDFKGIYCAIAGKGISRLITLETDYVIHYTNVTTRRAADMPDEFEREALAAFAQDNSLTEYYAMGTSDEGGRVFRYVAPLWAKESCLECHGEPAGELDQLGFEKEGLKEGDLGGAISIAMPVDRYLENIQGNIWQQVAFFAISALACILIIMVAVRTLVTKPLKVIGNAAMQIEDGHFDIDLSSVGDKDEAQDLASHFTSMAHELDELRNGLEGRVRVRTEQLARANQVLERQQHELERANILLQDESQYKSDFLAIMSHELKTPLTSILAYVELWEKLDVDRSEEEVEAIREIKESGQALLHMVNNILAAARMEAGRNELRLECVDMVDLVSMVEGTVGFLARKRDIDFSTRVDLDVPLIMADHEKTCRILENLASNAIKFTRRGGQVSIHVSCDAAAGEVLCEVSDNGIGIKREDLSRIFDRFSQVSRSTVRRYNGSGLGLAVALDLARLQGGTIDVESSYQVGSTFTLRVPLREAKEDLS